MQVVFTESFVNDGQNVTTENLSQVQESEVENDYARVYDIQILTSHDVEIIIDLNSYSNKENIQEIPFSSWTIK